MIQSPQPTLPEKIGLAAFIALLAAFVAALVWALFFAFEAGAEEAEPAYVVVSNAEIRPLEREELAAIFLRKAPKGLPDKPVDLARKSPVREAFSRDVHRRSAKAVANMWDHQAFSGGKMGPPIKSQDAAVQWVQRTTGGIAYVGREVDVAGLYQVTVKE